MVLWVLSGDISYELERLKLTYADAERGQIGQYGSDLHRDEFGG